MTKQSDSELDFTRQSEHKAASVDGAERVQTIVSDQLLFVTNWLKIWRKFFFFLICFARILQGGKMLRTFKFQTAKICFQIFHQLSISHPVDPRSCSERKMIS